VVFLLADYSVLSMGDYTFPAWSEGVGWVMTIICLGAIPAFMVYEMVKLKPRPLLQVQGTWTDHSMPSVSNIVCFYSLDRTLTAYHTQLKTH